MLQLSNIAQVIIAITIFIVWVPRFDNIVKEFKQYGLNDFIRSLVGTTKISLATLLVTAIWYPELATIPALMMAGLMICAQIAHFSVKNPWYKFVPSLLMLSLSLFVAAVHSGMLQ
jgi:hypothetical protein